MPWSSYAAILLRVLTLLLLIIPSRFSFSQSDSIVSSDLEYPLHYWANDSLVLNLREQKAYLYSEAHVDYGEYTVDACYIEFDFSSKVVSAQLCIDSTGKKVGVPVLSDGNTITEADSIKFNFESKRGITYHVKLQEGEGYIHGNRVKRQGNGQIHIDTALYTTCNLDHPHYYFKLRKAIIIPDDKIVSGPVNLFVADIPTPLGLPFAFFPNKKKGTNGIVLPIYGESSLGFFLSGGGYYHKFKNEQIATTFLGDIYSKGSWGLKNITSYKKKYKYDGSFTLNFRRTIQGEKEFDDYSRTTDFFVDWTHTQDAKAKPGTTFRGSIHAGTSTNFQNDFGNTVVNPEDYLSNNFNSNVAWGKTFKKIPSNLSVNFRHNQNSTSNLVTFTLPDVTYSVNRFYPAKWFDLKNATASPLRKGINKIGITYFTNIRNETSAQENQLSFDNMDVLRNNMRNGAKHTLNANASFSFLKQRITFTPSVSTNALMYLNSTSRYWDASNNEVLTDTIDQFSMPIWATFNASLTTKIYSFYEFADFLQGKKEARFRHSLTPNINLSLRPEGKYQYSYQNDSLGGLGYATPYDGYIFGTAPTGSSGRVGFNLINALEMKQVNLNDTTGEDPFTYRNILDNLTLSSGYDIYKDSLNFDNLSVSGRTKIGKFNTRFGSTFDPYSRDSLARKVNVFQKDVNGSLFNLTSANVGLNFTLNSKKKEKLKTDKGSEEELEFINNNPDEFIQFGEAWAWNLNVGYTLNYAKIFRAETDTFNLTQTINLSGDINVTHNWNVQFQTNYDITNKKFSYTSFNVKRDLHCWALSFNWIPFGIMKSYSIQINVKASVLQDLKLQRRNTWYDNGVR